MSDDRLRALFDVLDVEATEERLRVALAAEATDPGRAEVTQLARVASWSGGWDAAERLLQEADSLAGETVVARARVLLERGRIMRRTGGDAVALPLLEQAYEVALAARSALHRRRRCTFLRAGGRHDRLDEPRTRASKQVQSGAVLARDPAAQPW